MEISCGHVLYVSHLFCHDKHLSDGVLRQVEAGANQIFSHPTTRGDEASLARNQILTSVGGRGATWFSHGFHCILHLLGALELLDLSMVAYRRPATALGQANAHAGGRAPRPRPTPAERRARRVAQLRRVGIIMLRQFMLELLQGPSAGSRGPSASIQRSVGQRLGAFRRAVRALERADIGSFFLRFLGGRHRDRWHGILRRFDEREAARDNGVETGSSGSSESSRESDRN